MFAGCCTCPQRVARVSGTDLHRQLHVPAACGACLRGADLHRQLHVPAACGACLRGADLHRQLHVPAACGACLRGADLHRQLHVPAACGACLRDGSSQATARARSVWRVSPGRIFTGNWTCCYTSCTFILLSYPLTQGQPLLVLATKNAMLVAETYL